MTIKFGATNVQKCAKPFYLVYITIPESPKTTLVYVIPSGILRSKNSRTGRREESEHYTARDRGPINNKIL